MNKKERLEKAFNLDCPDRPPILGGWLAAPGHIQTLTGCSVAEYWTDPFHWGMEAERVLGSDGIITIFVPASEGEYRCVDQQLLEKRASYSIESVLAEIEGMPEVDEIEAGFNFEAEYRRFLGEFKTQQARSQDILWCPADWELIPKALWYHEFGYENALMTLALHPDRYHKLIQTSAVKGRQRAMLRARAIQEGRHPRAILTGEDLCSQRGPIVSPEFLRRDYFPLVEYALEPLLEVGAKIVWHCDGDYRPLLSDVLACGVGGLQGFQEECGMDLNWIVDLRTRQNDPLLIFGPISVTTTLPHGTKADIQAEIQRAINLCREKASLVFFTSNTLTPDIPLENILHLWQTVLESSWEKV
jgi:hypothetical protein